MKNAVIKRRDRYFDMPMGIYSGIIMSEEVMKKVHKLSYKFQEELKEILSNNLDEVHSASWILGYDKDGEQISLKYIDGTETKESKLERIDVLESTFVPIYLKDGFYQVNIKQEEVEGYMKENNIPMEEDFVHQGDLVVAKFNEEINKMMKED